jgi:hypothetical protein
MVGCECGFHGFVGYVQEYNYLSARLAWVRDRLAEGAGPPDPSLAKAYGVWTPPEPKPSTSPQTLLVTIGAGLLIIAALVFVAVAWETIGPWGQIGSLVLLTALVAVAAVGSRRRAPRAAEALAVVAFSLGVICATAAPVLGALPETWDSGQRPYRLIVAVLAAAWGIVLGRRFRLRSWSWLGWLFVPIAVGLALVLASGWSSNDQASITVSGLTFFAVAVLLHWRASAPDTWPMRTAAGVCLAFTGGLLLAALTYDPPAGAVLLVTAVLLAAVLLRVEWLGWPLFGFWLALTTLFLPTGPWTTAGVAVLGVVLLAVVRQWGVGLAVISAGVLWTVYFIGSAFESPSVMAAIVGIGLVAYAMFPGAAPVAWIGAGFAWIAYMLEAPDPAFFELPLLVLAALLLVAGLIARRSGTRNSGITFGPALTVALIPSAILCWWEVWETPALIRFGIVMAVGVPLLIIGVRRHMLGLVAPATAAVSIAATAQIVATLDLLPRWLALAIAGGILIAIGARIEWVRERGRETEQWLQTLR